jgi:hypothetical protein
MAFSLTMRRTEAATAGGRGLVAEVSFYLLVSYIHLRVEDVERDEMERDIGTYNIAPCYICIWSWCCNC